MAQMRLATCDLSLGAGKPQVAQARFSNAPGTDPKEGEPTVFVDLLHHD